jgi:uncharacterized SAM-binding protein YcdF (DUF218 family)
VIGVDEPAVESLARPLTNRPRRWLLSTLAATLLVLLLILAFRRQVLTGLGESLVVSDPLEQADLIYVFAGDFWGSRVLFGAKLGMQGWAPRVILSGGRYMDSYASDLSVDFAVGQGYPRSLFVPVRLEARSTVDEARAMGPVFHRLGARRIILVTSNFHSRRAEQVFRLFLPEFDFRMEASPDDAFHPGDWWGSERERDLLFGEYEKMIGTLLVRFHLASAGWLRQVHE